MDRGGYRGRGGYGRRRGGSGDAVRGGRGGRGGGPGYDGGRGRSRGGDAGGQHYRYQQQQQWGPIPGGDGGQRPQHSSGWPGVVASGSRGGQSGGRGAWGGQGGGWGPRPARPVETEGSTLSSSQHVEAGQVAERMQEMEITKQPPPKVAIAWDRSKLVPIRRPDRGRSCGKRTVHLRANHFPVSFDSESIIQHYDIDVKPEAPSWSGRPVGTPKSDLAMIRDKFFSDNPLEFPLSMTAYDRYKNIFSMVSLPAGTYRVELFEVENMRSRAYNLTLKLVNELTLCKLNDYLNGTIMSIPRDIIQGMDVVMRENLARRLIHIGRSFCKRELCEEDFLGGGIVAYRGFHHSLKPTSQALSMVLDYSVLAFRKPLPVLEFLREHIRNFSIGYFQNYERQVSSALKGLKVTVTHCRTKQKYTIARLTDKTTRQLRFSLDGPEGNSRNINLVQYYREKYGVNIQNQDIPCLDLGKNNKANYVPMEFCVLLERQRFPKECLDRDTTAYLQEISLPLPYVRDKMIRNMVEGINGPYGGGLATNFGFKVNTTMTTLSGRVIEPPVLKLGGQGGRITSFTIDNDKCQWNLVHRCVVQGRAIKRWAILDLTSSDRFFLDQSNFVYKLTARCRNLGIHMKQPLIVQNASMNLLSNLNQLERMLESVKKNAHQMCGEHLQILICVMTRKDPGYNYLKWLSETKVGLVTQCCLVNKANKGQDQYLANLGLKINAKVGGSNVELNDELPCPRLKSHVMFIGADVNHPSPSNKSCPSIAAVVGTMNWPAANRYAARICPQSHRKEKILQFGGMCLDLIRRYAQVNKVRPPHIVIFRGGVSESQFDMVLNEEIYDLRTTLAKENYTPSITLIVAQKRHKTRLFPNSPRDGVLPSGNVPPGTVVDTKIIHPFEFDFYLCSHFGGIGTSKPTHYHVLWDEHRFSSDELQQLIYHLCFTFARCTKPVSLVPPVYYADLVAYRGRLYQKAVLGGRLLPSTASASSSSSATTSYESFLRLHADLRDNMFFV